MENRLEVLGQGRLVRKVFHSVWEEVMRICTQVLTVGKNRRVAEFGLYFRESWGYGVVIICQL